MNGGKMKKQYLIFLVISLAFFTYCSNKESTFKIKAGIVMQSGDVKNVARQEFLVVITDVLILWEDSKKKHMKDFDLIEREIKQENDYENTILKLETELRKNNTFISQKGKKDNSEVLNILKEIEKYLDTGGGTYLYDSFKYYKKRIQQVRSGTYYYSVPDLLKELPDDIYSSHKRSLEQSWSESFSAEIRNQMKKT